MNNTKHHRLVMWACIMGLTIIYGMLFDKSMKDFKDRLQFIGIFSFILISLSDF